MSSTSVCPVVFFIVIWLFSSCFPGTLGWNRSWPSDIWQPSNVSGLLLWTVSLPCWSEIWLSSLWSLRIVLSMVCWLWLWLAEILPCHWPSAGLQPSMPASCSLCPCWVLLLSVWVRPLVPSFDSLSCCWHRLIWPNVIWSSLRRCDTWRLFSSSTIVPLRLRLGTLVVVAPCKQIDHGECTATDGCKR